jgi:hypothetical protein
MSSEKTLKLKVHLINYTYSFCKKKVSKKNERIAPLHCICSPNSFHSQLLGSALRFLPCAFAHSVHYVPSIEKLPVVPPFVVRPCRTPRCVSQAHTLPLVALRSFFAYLTLAALFEQGLVIPPSVASVISPQKFQRLIRGLVLIYCIYIIVFKYIMFYCIGSVNINSVVSIIQATSSTVTDVTRHSIKVLSFSVLINLAQILDKLGKTHLLYNTNYGIN